LRTDVEIVRAVEIRFVDDRTIERRFEQVQKVVTLPRVWKLRRDVYGFF